MGGFGGGAMGGLGGGAMGGGAMLGGAMAGFGEGAMGGLGGGAMRAGAMGGFGGSVIGGMGGGSPFGMGSGMVGMQSGSSSAGVGLASGVGSSSRNGGQGSSQSGFGSSQSGWGSSQSGWGSSQSGWGSSQASSPSSGWSPVSGSSAAGIGSPAGFGAGRFGFPGAGFGAGLPITGLTGGAAGLGWGFNPQQRILNTTITCAFTATGFTGSVTLRRAAWGWVRRSPSGSMTISSTTGTGTFSVVLTERSRTEAGCTSDGLGPVIASNLRWGMWSMGSSNRGVLATVTLSANQQNNVNLANLPFNELDLYAGRGLALCSTLTTGVDGRQVCSDPIPACCKLGFDDMDAITP
ncbi:uncharacterized protein [Haliotis cracherodii]|uniref:uncharacterized protein n=1 Tax=Haliotis cracherodii TaxID=6455 RepID=UPI0039EC8784